MRANSFKSLFFREKSALALSSHTKKMVPVHGANVPFYVIARSAFGGPWQSKSLHFR